MADDGEDLVSNVKIDGLDESTKKLEEFGDKGSEAFKKVSDAADKAGDSIGKSSSEIEKGAKKAGDSVQGLNENLGSIKGDVSASELNKIEGAARDLSSRAVKVSKDLAQFATRVAALATAGAAAIIGIGKLGATLASQVNQTTSAFDENNAAQQRAVSATLSSQQAAIQYANQQSVLNKQVANGTISYDQYFETLKSNQQSYKDQIKVTAQLEAAQESAREETERLQKAAADHKAFDDLTQTFGGPLTSSLIALGNVVIATKNQFIQSFGPSASAVVDMLTAALNTNGQAISSFFANASAKISEFVSKNGPAIQQALSSIGAAAGSIFNGLIDALPSLLDIFNNQLVPAVKSVAGFVDGLVKGFNNIFGTNFTTGAAVVIVALTSMVGGFKTLLGFLGLVQPGLIVLRAIFASMLGPIGLLVIAFTALYFAIDWQKFGANAVAAGQAILNFFTGLPDTISGFFTTMFAAVKSGWDTLSQGVIDAWNGVVKFFSSLPDTVGKIFTSITDSIKTAFTDAFTAVSNYVQGWVESIKKFLQPLIDMINIIASGGGASASSNGDSTPAFAGGGRVTGPGTSTSDSILAWLSNNEFVMQAKAVRKYGTSFMRAINSGHFDLSRLAGFAVGGLVGPSPRPLLPSLTPSFSQAKAAMSLSLSIGGEQFDNLVVTDEDTAGRLTRYAINKQSRAAGRRPSWSGR